MLASHVVLARKLDALEKKYDAQFKVVFDTIRQLMTPPEPKRQKIGFTPKKKAGRVKTCLEGLLFQNQVLLGYSKRRLINMTRA